MTGADKFLPSIDPNLRRIYRRLFRHKGRIALAGVFMIGSASTSSITATLLGKLTDLGFYQQEAWVVAAAPAALIAVTVLFGLCSVASTLLMARVTQTVLSELRTELFEKILRWPAERVQANPTGLICSKFVNEANAALSGAASSLIVLVRDSVQILGLLALLFWQNWQLTLVTFVAGPLIVWVLRRISGRLRRIVRKSQETVADMIVRVKETYEARREVKMAGSFAFEEERFDAVNRRIRQNELKRLRVQSLATPLTQMITMLGVAFVVGAALYEAQMGMLTIGEFITFLSALLLLKAPLQHLTGLNGTFATITVAAGSVFETMDAASEEDAGTFVKERAEGEIVFEDVTLRYPGEDKPSLNRVNLKIRPGEHLALVGRSGAGKSSFVHLLPRFWNPSQGRVLLDGVDLRDWTLASLRNQIAIVSQDVVLFDDTVRNNVAYGLFDKTDEEILAALDAAALSDFVESLPNGLDTRVGEGGNLLSGGQKQRLSIARALLKNAPILILDEATSALDSENEAAVKTSLQKLMAGRTTITVAHRFSTIESADRIVVLDEGRVAEIGTVSELLKKEGLFAKLWRLQKVGQNPICQNVFPGTLSNLGDKNGVPSGIPQ